MRAEAASASSILNAWRVQIPKPHPEAHKYALDGIARNGTTQQLFAIMPAHVAIHPYRGRWKRSALLARDPALSLLSWRIPVAFTEATTHASRYAHDLAWASIDTHPLNALPLMYDVNKKANFFQTRLFHRQAIRCPEKGLNDEHKESYESQESPDTPLDTRPLVLGGVDGIAYQSNDEPLLEIQNVGYRGFSGALAMALDRVVEHNTDVSQDLETALYSELDDERRRLGAILGLVVGVREDGDLSHPYPLLQRRSMVLPAWQFASLIYGSSSVNIDTLNGKKVLHAARGYECR